jgi:hypothetical protein
MRLTLLLLALAALHAQDTRKVAEPKFPPACEVLTAKLAAPAGALSDAGQGSNNPDHASSLDHKRSLARSRIHAIDG